MANHNRRWKSNEPIIMRSKFMQIGAQSAGKSMRPSCLLLAARKEREIFTRSPRVVILNE